MDLRHASFASHQLRASLLPAKNCIVGRSLFSRYRSDVSTSVPRQSGASARCASCAVAFEFTPTIAAADLFPTLLYLPLPLLIAAAVRFGAKGASGAIFVFIQVSSMNTNLVGSRWPCQERHR